MENQNNNEEFSKSGSDARSEQVLIHKKMDDLILLLSQTKPDQVLLQELQTKFNSAIRASADSTALEPYKKKRNISISDEADSDFGQLLLMNNLDKPTRKKLETWQIVNKAIRIIIALLLILLGFGMIIMPAPPYFEMFTLFYLNPNDGVTIMDVISLIIVFVGIYILLSVVNLIKKNK